MLTIPVATLLGQHGGAATALQRVCFSLPKDVAVVVCMEEEQGLKDQCTAVPGAGASQQRPDVLGPAPLQCVPHLPCVSATVL